MRTDTFRTALVDLEARAEAGDDLAVMCAETLWWRCHRRLIADALVAGGFVVRHLIDRPPGHLHRISATSIATMGIPEPRFEQPAARGKRVRAEAQASRNQK
jgi:uncharacterized protein (DUF488 family)